MRPSLRNTVRSSFRTAPLALLLLVPTAGWQANDAERLALAPQSRLWVEGTSTVKDFSCKAGALDAIVDARGGGAIAQVLAGEKAVLSMDMKVPAEKLDCGNGTMNDHMRKALKVEEQPTILFRMTSYDVTKGSNGAVTGTLRGTLSMGGVQKPLSFTADGKGEGDMLRVTGGTDIKMTEWGLKPPTLMFGRIKVNELVKVKFDLLLKS